MKKILFKIQVRKDAFLKAAILGTVNSENSWGQEATKEATT